MPKASTPSSRMHAVNIPDPAQSSRVTAEPAGNNFLVNSKSRSTDADEIALDGDLGIGMLRNFGCMAWNRVIAARKRLAADLGRNSTDLRVSSAATLKCRRLRRWLKEWQILKRRNVLYRYLFVMGR